MDYKNSMLFEDVLPWKEAHENCSPKITIETSSSNHHQLKDEFELRKSRWTKMTTTSSPHFRKWTLSLLQDNILSRSFLLGKKINNEIESIINNNTWKLVDLPLKSQLLRHKLMFNRKMKIDGTIHKYNGKLVVQVFKGQENMNYFDIYPFVWRINSIRALIRIIILKYIKQM